MSAVPIQTVGRDGPFAALSNALAEAPQLHRLREEVCYLLARIREQSAGVPGQYARVDAELRWWRDATGHTLLDCVRRSFAVRQLCLRLADSDGSWRNAISYIGDTDPRDEIVCTYDYDRAEIRFPATSALASPYGWTSRMEVQISTWYARTGMSAITAWLIAASRIAHDSGQRCTVLTNRLYHETAILFELTELRWLEIKTFDDCAEIAAAARSIDSPMMIFLDSSRPDGHADAVRRLLRDIDASRVGCVVWDNTCAPADEHPFADEVDVAAIRTSVLLLRSHAKLDQLGLELCALGSLALLNGPRPSRLARTMLDGLANYLPDTLAVSGGCASPPVLRLLDALGLPMPALAARGNRLLRTANAFGAELLRDALEPSGRYVIEDNEHHCFVEIHVLDLPGPPELGAPAVWVPWEGFDRTLTQVEQQAAVLTIPIWKSASFGFHYTGLSWYPAEDGPYPHGHPHTVLRLCFGMHDPNVVAQVADLVAANLLHRPDWSPAG